MAWVYRDLVGIDTSPDGAGFRHIVIHPRPNAAVTHATGEYQSVYGKISTEWTEGPNSFSLKVAIPANTTATIYVPALSNARVWEHGSPVEAPEENGSYVVQSGSGVYSIEVK